jgi:hypothetical protein
VFVIPARTLDRKHTALQVWIVRMADGTRAARVSAARITVTNMNWRAKDQLDHAGPRTLKYDRQREQQHEKSCKPAEAHEPTRHPHKLRTFSDRINDKVPVASHFERV